MTIATTVEYNELPPATPLKELFEQAHGCVERAIKILSEMAESMERIVARNLLTDMFRAMEEDPVVCFKQWSVEVGASTARGLTLFVWMLVERIKTKPPECFSDLVPDPFEALASA